jgi:hypothetical protein
MFDFRSVECVHDGGVTPIKTGVTVQTVNGKNQRIGVIYDAA